MNALAVWRQDCELAGVEPSVSVFEELSRRYEGRPFHNVEHVLSVREWVRQLSAEPVGATLMAAWFHDAVYEPGAPDNEEKSANLTRALLPNGLHEEVSRLILLTQHHSPAASDVQGKILCDADLSVLGQPSGDYMRYALAIREEFAHVADRQYWSGRMAFLRSIFSRERIYLTKGARAALEKQARVNTLIEHSWLNVQLGN